MICIFRFIRVRGGQSVSVFWKMIDFSFTEGPEIFRKAAREIAATKVAPKVAEIEETWEVSDEMPILEGE